MKHLILIVKTSIVMFAMSMFLTTPSVHAEDIEIYGIADTNNPPVNVLFVFDLSGSMRMDIDGTDVLPHGDPDSRYSILQDALTNVLANNKDIGNLRVGLSWFSKYSSGIRWPVTGIRDDIHGRDTSIPAGTYETWEYLPEAFRSFGSIHDDWKTKMVPSLLEAAYYFQGDEVWRGRRREPQQWHVNQKRFTWGNKYSSHFSSYTPSDAALASPYPEYRGTKAYAKYEELRTTNKRSCNSRPVDAAHPLPDWCHNGYNTPAGIDDHGVNRWRMNVRECGTRTRSYTTEGGSCRVEEEDYDCTPQSNDPETGLPRPDICVCPPDEWDSSSSADYTQHYCKHDYASNRSEWFGATYNSPIGATCTPSYIVLLSDGAPTVTHTASSDGSFMGAPGGTDVRIEHMTGNTCADIPDVPFGKCGPELVEHLATEDQSEDYAGSKVLTYTIGFNVDGAGKDYLELLAEKGKGVFYPASSAADLEDAFDLIIDSITGENETFTGLVTTIRASTLSSDNRVFMNMFKPGDTQTWNGNTKGYFISPEGLLDVDGSEAVTIVDGAERFKDDSTSFWSNSADGNFVELGGASAKLGDSTRHIYTYADTGNAPDDSDLTKITTTETDITASLMGVGNDTDKDDLISWLYDSKMSDPLHAKPVLMSYSGQDVLYSMTNQGLLHAIDTTHPGGYHDYNGGNELFAFIPQALLPQLPSVKANLAAAGHLYGLDGPISYLHIDDKAGTNSTDRDRIINNGEDATLFFGMRRGGRNYYALDISTPSTHTLKWRIEGGVAPFEKLGQSWSRMVPTTVNWQGTNKKVLFFAGGYDEAHDTKTSRSADSVGNAIFMVDASDGSLLWSAQQNGSQSASLTVLDQLKYSVPADITVIDSDDNRIADRLYFGDLGGQVWRIDLDEDNFGTQSSAASGFRLGDFGVGGTTDSVESSDGSEDGNEGNNNEDCSDDEAGNGNGNNDGVNANDGDNGSDDNNGNDDGNGSNNGNGNNSNEGECADDSSDSEEEDDVVNRNNRRFFSAPSVAKIRSGNNFHYAIAIGSGWRSHPLELEEDNRFYMIKDTNVDPGAPVTEWTTLSEGDLYDITDNQIGEGDASERATAKAALESAGGWLLKLEHSGESGEKNLTASLIFDHKLAFTTFTPANGGNDICGGGGGTGRFYLINLEDGTPIMDLEENNTPPALSAQHRSKTVPGMGIPTEPVLYFPPGIGRADLYVGKHKAGTVDNPMIRINWKVVE